MNNTDMASIPIQIDMNFERQIETVGAIKDFLSPLSGDDLVSGINRLREIIHEYSPFKSEPTDFVRWVPNGNVYANQYNPNSVAPPEMELLRLSIDADGYTQPIVAMPDGNGGYEVVDGFHRHRVGKEMPSVQKRVKGYLPLVCIRQTQTDQSDRMASTIRHNRARGKHSVQAMSDIVIELKKRNWTDAKIAQNLGMDADEVLRLCQISGLAEVFAGSDFSQSWDVDGATSALDFADLTEDFDDDVEVRTSNTSDPTRVFHSYEKWECYAAGFYATGWPGRNKDECETIYARFLADDDAFRKALDGVTSEWSNSCEHYLTNSAMNRIAYLGQAAACYAHGLPAVYCGGFQLLTEEQKDIANATALEYLNLWLVSDGREPVTMEQANPGRQSNIY